MKRLPIVIGIALVAAAAASAWWWFGHAASGPTDAIRVSGNVVSTVRTVQAPAIAYPTPDVAAGIPSSPTASMSANTAGQRRGASAMPSMQPTISGSLDAVYVKTGDHVASGTPIAQLDTTVLDLGVAAAKASSARAHAQVSVMKDNLGTIADNQGKLADARSQLATAQKKIDAAKKEIATGKSQLKAGIKALEATIAGPHPPGPWPPPPLAQKLAQLKATLAKVEAGEKKLATAQVKLDSGRAKISQGASALRDARTQVTNARETLSILADGQDILVDVAEYRRSQATIIAPATGTVTEARAAGTVAMVNAPVVRIRPDAATQVETYLTGEQLLAVAPGAKAIVDYDSNAGEPLTGTVTSIGDRAVFPPTSFPTDIVHMTKAVRVVITLDGGGWAPPGTPVDIRIEKTE